MKKITIKLTNSCKKKEEKVVVKEEKKCFLLM